MGFESELNLPDPDPVATQEWVDSILAVRNQLGNEEARRLLLATVRAARETASILICQHTICQHNLTERPRRLPWRLSFRKAPA